MQAAVVVVSIEMVILLESAAQAAVVKEMEAILHPLLELSILAVVAAAVVELQAVAVMAQQVAVV
jgi:hypothetical protein